MNVATTQRSIVWTSYLRPAPVAAEAALRVLSVGELDASTLALVIGSDSGLTAAVVRATEPAAIDASIADRLRGLTPSRLQSALFPALTDALAASAGGFSDSDLHSWRYSLATAIAAESIAAECDVATPDAAYIAGLMHNCVGASRTGDRSGTEQPPMQANVRALARRYRFPAWLVECIENQDDPDDADTSAESCVLRVLALAKTMATDLTRADESSCAALAESSLRLRFDMVPVLAARERAARSLERRLSLFAFSPSSTADLQSTLLRFSNHLLLHWRVDETSAAMLRERADHLSALVRFESAMATSVPADELVLACADGLRASLRVERGLIAVWADATSLPIGIRWNNVAGLLEPLPVISDSASTARSIESLLADGMWPAGGSDAAAPSVVPIYTPAHRHVGYMALATSAAHGSGWLEYVSEWSAALGRAIERAHEAEREDFRRKSQRRFDREPSEQPAADRAEPGLAIVRQKNIARAAMAALHAPLGNITTQAHGLISQTADLSTQHLVEELAKQARNAARVMADLRILASSGDNPNEFVLVNAPLRQFLQAARPRLERRSIQLTEHLSDGLPRIRADVRKLQHLFTNLFAFIEHRLGHTGRTIAVSTAPSDDRSSASLRIETAGIAITREQADSLFTPFESHDRASNDYALALAACGTIVHEIGGSISASTTGDGAVIDIRFDAVHAVLAVERQPTHDPCATVPLPPAPQGDDPGDGVRVLIVDDDEAMRDLMKQALLRRDYCVDIAKDGVEALRMLESSRVDVLLLDLLMPNRDGFAVLREMMRRGSTPPTIVMTGSRSADVRKEAMELGACSFLQKPFELGQLLAEVESVLVHQRT